MPINAKRAVQIAANYYKEISGQIVNLTIEEVELDDNFWFITLGIEDQYSIPTIGGKASAYKIFKIDADTGEVQSMKIRTI